MIHFYRRYGAVSVLRHDELAPTIACKNQGVIILRNGTECSVALRLFGTEQLLSIIVYMQTLLVWDYKVIHAATELRIYSLHHTQCRF